MKMEYDLYFGDTVAGKVYVRREGLYYCIQCDAEPPVMDKYWLAAEKNGNPVIIGMCVPEGKRLRSFNRFAVNRLPEGEYKFCLVTEKDPSDKIPIYADQAFPNLQEIESGMLYVHNGRFYLKINPERLHKA